MKEPDWKKMYLKAIDSMENALEALPLNVETETGRSYLIQAMLEAEKIYLETAENDAAGPLFAMEKAAGFCGDFG